MEWDDLLKFAITKCKLSTQEFFSLSWFEFRAHVDKVKDRVEEQRVNRELAWEHTRVIWSVLMNTGFKKEGGGKFLPTDLIKLSFDSVPEIEKPSLEVFDKLVKKHGKRRKKNG